MASRTIDNKYFSSLHDNLTIVVDKARGIVLQCRLKVRLKIIQIHVTKIKGYVEENIDLR